MKSFYYDTEMRAFGVKDEEKFKIILFHVNTANIKNNKAVVYSDNGTIYEYNLINPLSGEYTFKNITL